MSRLVARGAEERRRARARSRSAVWPPSVSVRSSIGTRSGGLLRRSIRGLAGALGRLVLGERLRGVDVAEALVLRRELLPAGGRTPRRFAITPTIVRAFISPIPGSASRRRSRSAPSRAPVQTAAASPSYSLAIAAQNSCVRRAMLAGKRCSAGFSRKASSSSSGSIAAISPASSPPSRCESTSGEENAFCTVTCWSSTKPIISASGLSPRNASASGSPEKWIGVVVAMSGS